jgi:hypothetical protein
MTGSGAIAMGMGAGLVTGLAARAFISAAARQAWPLAMAVGLLLVVVLSMTAAAWTLVPALATQHGWPWLGAGAAAGLGLGQVAFHLGASGRVDLLAVGGGLKSGSLLSSPFLIVPLVGVAAAASFATANLSGDSGAASVRGGSGRHVSYYIEGVIVSRKGCEGVFYRSAPTPGGTGNVLHEMWLSDGILHSTNGGGYSTEYTGILKGDGSFHLVWTGASPSGEKARIDGTIKQDGTITGTWDGVFTNGCVNHFLITRGHLMSNNTLRDLTG